MNMPRLRLSLLSMRDLALVGLPLLALVVAAFWIAYHFVKPAPPDTFVLATGGEEGGYHAMGQRYQKLLEREGITVVLQSTAGSVENLAHLVNEDSEVEVAFVQAGNGDADDYPGLVSLGSVYYEPVWIFYRGAKLGDQLRQLSGKRIAIGATGSGTRRLATQLLLVNQAWAPPTKIVDLSGDEAAEALVQGKIDAAFLVGPADVPYIRSLLLAPDVKLLSFDRTTAYTKVFPFLSAVTLAQGTIDLVRDIPPRDVMLLAPTANIIAKETLHPALSNLLMQAMAEIHSGAGILHKAGDFPAARSHDFPLSPEALRFYKSGPPFLQRYLPFWAATLVDRIIVLLVPLLAVLIPVLKFAPSLYTWRIRTRIYRWYGELKFLELELREKFDPSRVAEYRQRLDKLEEVAHTRPIPLAFTDQVYTLRQHIDMVRGILDRMTQQTAH
jgi:TRAP transporter TAXI family solute receptor